MAYEPIAGGHRLVLEDRARLVISGVEEVHRFDEESILLATNMGELEIQGEGLHIEKLSLDGGELHVDGTVSALIYDTGEQEARGFLRRLFGG